jgi:hypothetical protein
MPRIKQTPKKPQKKEGEKELTPFRRTFARNTIVYITARPLAKSSHEKQFTQEDLIFYLEKEINFENYLPITTGAESRGFFAIEVSHYGIDEIAPRTATFQSHQLCFTRTLPPNWNTTDYSKSYVFEEQFPTIGVSKDNEDRFSFNVPKDIQLYILGMCTARDLCRISCCSKYWRSVVDSNQLWKNLCLRVFPSSKEQVASIQELNNQLKILSLYTRKDYNYEDEFEGMSTIKFQSKNKTNLNAC